MMKKVGQLFRDGLSNRIKNVVKESNNVFVVNFDKLSASQLTGIRKNFDKVGAKVSVSRNSIARVALKDLNFVPLADTVTRQTAFINSNGDSVEISKILVKYAKDIENLKISGGVIEGKILSGADIKRLADLPSREVLLSMLLSTLQSPLTRLAGALTAKHRDLLSVLKQLSEKRDGNSLQKGGN